MFVAYPVSSVDVASLFEKVQQTFSRVEGSGNMNRRMLVFVGLCQYGMTVGNRVQDRL